MGGFIDDAIRVLRLAKKPTKEEFITIAKVTGVGMIIIGIIGTLIVLGFRFIGIAG